MSKKEEEKEEFNIVKEILGWVLYFAVIIGLTFFIVTFVGQRTRVSGSSMCDTLHDGDNLIVDKLSYRFSDPERFDIIVFPFRYERKTYYIKRIIGLPGETVQVSDGYVYINGELLQDDTYGRELMDWAGIAEEPIELGEDEYFVLGDNRNNSSDSRDPSVGVLNRSELIGRAFVRIYPFDQIEMLGK